MTAAKSKAVQQFECVITQSQAAALQQCHNGHCGNAACCSLTQAANASTAQAAHTGGKCHTCHRLTAEEAAGAVRAT